MKTPIKCMFVAVLLLMTLAIVQPALSFIENVGEPVAITGIVYECGARGSGIQIDTGDEIVSVFGKGPIWYWQAQDVDFPEVGDTVTIYAYEITFSDGTVKLVADSIDLDDDEIADIDLRDDEGRPLWRQQGKRISQSQCQAQEPSQAQSRKGAHWAE